jgi:hypothetical protein
MDINTNIKDLGEIDTNSLRDAILSLDESIWTAQKIRQNEFEVHKQTSSVLLVFTDGSNWPNIEVSKEQGWELLSATALPIMHEILDRHYTPGGTIIRAMAARLPVGGLIKPHVDKHPSFHAGHRIHVPITTNSRVRFMIDGRPFKLEVGRAYEINNQRKHSVMNKGKEDRITLIFDYVPAAHMSRDSLPT